MFYITGLISWFFLSFFLPTRLLFPIFIYLSMDSSMVLFYIALAFMLLLVAGQVWIAGRSVSSGGVFEYSSESLDNIELVTMPSFVDPNLVNERLRAGPSEPLSDF
jgi:hypothetical protein